LGWGWGWGWQAAIVARAPELVIQYSELRLGGVVAEGGSGVVVKGYFGAAPIVAKSVRSQFMEGNFDEIQREMAMLYRLRHSGLTTFYGACFHDPALMLIQARVHPPSRTPG
jgi:hypothetical protein